MIYSDEADRVESYEKHKEKHICMMDRDLGQKMISRITALK